MKYKSEEKFIDIVEKCLTDCGCKTWREVIPDNCKDWENPYRVDLIFYRDDFGYIGVEGKNINTLRSGGKIYNAVEQIENKYKKQTYFGGNFISRWCVLVPTEVNWISEEVMNEIKLFIKNFLRRGYKISLMEYSGGGITIDSYTKNSLYINSENDLEKSGGIINGEKN